MQHAWASQVQNDAQNSTLVQPQFDSSDIIIFGWKQNSKNEKKRQAGAFVIYKANFIGHWTPNNVEVGMLKSADGESTLSHTT